MRTRRARRLFGAVLLAAGGTAVVVHAVGADPITSEPLLEAPGCGAVVEMPASPPVTAVGDLAVVPVLAVVLPTVFIWIDEGGAARRVTTNTGCAPRRDDRFLTEQLGHPRAASVAPVSTVAAMMTGAFTGDWREAGRWHDL